MTLKKGKEFPQPPSKVRNWGNRKINLHTESTKFSEIAPDIAFPEFNFYEFIIFFLTRKLAVNAEFLWWNRILAMKNRQVIWPKRPETDIKLKF